MSLACIMTSGSVAPSAGVDYKVKRRQEALAQLAALPAKEQKLILQQAELMRVQRAHEQRLDLWRDALKTYVRAERGRTSDLARYLGVRRQSVWRWVNDGWSKFPAWAAVASIVWYFRQSPAQAVVSSGSLIHPALQLVSPQADKFVRGSPDKDELSAAPTR